MAIFKQISEQEAKKRREAYAREHKYCWCLIFIKGDVYLCLKYNIDGWLPHHLSQGRGRDEYECKANYYPLGWPFRDRNHHMGFGHAENKDMSVNVGESRLWMFAFKYLIGEASMEKIVFLMQNKSWWIAGMDPEWTLEDEIKKRARYLMARIKNLHLLNKSFDKEAMSGRIDKLKVAPGKRPGPDDGN